MDELSAPCGIVPAAGAGLRLRPFNYPKELLPVAYAPMDDGLRPVLAIELALQHLVDGGCSGAVIAVGAQKLELVRLLRSGEALGLPLAYVHQENPSGLTDEVLCCTRWAVDRPCVLVMPHTWFTPGDVVQQLMAVLGDGADLALAVFPTERTAQLGPVEYDTDGTVLAVYDKPEGPAPGNTWGVAAWRPTFTRFIEAWADDQRRATPIGHAFHAAIEAGLDVRAVPFPEGCYQDLGTPRSLADLVLR